MILIYGWGAGRNGEWFLEGTGVRFARRHEGTGWVRAPFLDGVFIRLVLFQKVSNSPMKIYVLFPLREFYLKNLRTILSNMTAELFEGEEDRYF